ncbi:AraC family transcriptional regulator [Streptomyces sp. AC495_CC817]|uniref:AraC family transcriptional regulator n=1 Tax=Streptomyces sp. AC495_CC817 TaxID=2823900 RepID=UPI001C26C1CD|nr:AraC family transcriptional regulator [Streptomyces sp. AC495_CC817]
MPLSAPITMPRASQVLSSRSTVFAGSADQAHETISDLFCEHRLGPAAHNDVRMRLRSAHEGGVGIDLLDYGEAVRISPVGLQTFHLVQIPLAGRARMQVGSIEVQSSASVATVPPVDRDFTMVWDSDTPHLIVYVGREQLETARSGLFGDLAPQKPLLGPELRLDTDEGRAFLRAVFELHDAHELTHQGGAYARALAAETMITRLLLAADASASGAAEPATSAGGRGWRLYQRFLEQAESSTDAELSVLQIANALGVPLRTLQDHVHAASGSTPTAILRDARFRRARELLIAADPQSDTVTAIAERCGFGHLGRFAADYRGRFGESPTETLRG